jgi:hypothetical protein
MERSRKLQASSCRFQLGSIREFPEKKKKAKRRAICLSLSVVRSASMMQHLLAPLIEMQTRCVKRVNAT